MPSRVILGRAGNKDHAIAQNPTHIATASSHVPFADRGNNRIRPPPAADAVSATMPSR
jgi:hypothetical protein